MQDPAGEGLPFSAPEGDIGGALGAIQRMLRAASGGRPLFPPTLLYNEGWLLRLVLDWFSRHDVQGHPLSFGAGARWFSEALLPSAFLARHRGDRLAESWTHADGVVGHFLIGEGGKADLRLAPEAGQLPMLEAKLFGGLSPGVAHAGYYDQAARTVACMSEVLRRAGRHPSTMTGLGFYVLAPASQIERGFFARAMAKESLLEKVRQTSRGLRGAKDQWFERWFRPTWEMIDIGCLSWEEIIAVIQEKEPSAGAAIAHFYEYCLRFNP
jgi:hypothetical protein